MAQTKSAHASAALPAANRISLRTRIVAAIKWWGEHQAWPATDEIRIERRTVNCR